MKGIKNQKMGFGMPPAGSGTGVFAENAEKYWSRQLSVIPVTPETKAAAVKNWPGYCNNLPNPKDQKTWTRKYGGYGIALATGKELIEGWRIAAVDVDDDRFVDAVQTILGNCPCAKKGKKGSTFIVFANQAMGAFMGRRHQALPGVIRGRR